VARQDGRTIIDLDTVSGMTASVALFAKSTHIIVCKLYAMLSAGVRLPLTMATEEGSAR
jgi:hypothetical protein